MNQNANYGFLPRWTCIGWPKTKRAVFELKSLNLKWVGLKLFMIIAINP